jgi:hypothetical protein
MTFHSHRYLEGQDGAIGLAFVALGFAVLACACLRPRLIPGASLLTAALFIFIICINSQYIRYVYPAFPILILSFTALYSVHKSQSLYGKLADRASLVTLAALIVVNLVLVPTGIYLLRNFDLLAMISPAERKAVQIRDVPIRSLIPIINDLAGTKARVGFISEPYGTDLEGTPIFGNWYNPRFFLAVAGIKTVGDGLSVLREFKLTHIIIADHPQGLLEAHQASVDVLRQASLENGRKVANVGGISLIELNDSIVLDEPIIDHTVANGLSRWRYLSNKSASPTSDGVELAAPQQLWYPATIPVNPFRVYQLAVTAACIGETNVVALQMNWLDVSGKFLSADSSGMKCAPQGETAIIRRFEAPSKAKQVMLYIGTTGIPSILLKRVTFSAGQMDSQGIEPSSIR